MSNDDNNDEKALSACGKWQDYSCISGDSAPVTILSDDISYRMSIETPEKLIG